LLFYPGSAFHAGEKSERLSEIIFKFSECVLGINTEPTGAYSGDCDRPFRPNVTGDSAGSAL
jgi:hypothetical protein